MPGSRHNPAHDTAGGPSHLCMALIAQTPVIKPPTTKGQWATAPVTAVISADTPMTAAAIPTQAAQVGGWELTMEEAAPNLLNERDA